MNEERLISLKEKFAQSWNTLSGFTTFYCHDELYESAQYLEEKKSENDYWSEITARQLFKTACVYLEVLGFSDYLIEFKKKYTDLIDNKKAYKEITRFPISYGDYDEDLLLLDKLHVDLYPFDLIPSNATRENTELLKVQTILKSTDDILKITKTRVESETSINKVMRDILDLYYHDVKKPRKNFFREKFKSYEPDLYIPEIYTTIEYKLIREEKDIANKIDELKIDADVYKINHENKYCIAVFCISKSVTKTEKQILTEWESRKFPKHWKLVIVKNIEIEKGVM